MTFNGRIVAALTLIQLSFVVGSTFIVRRILRSLESLGPGVGVGKDSFVKYWYSEPLTSWTLFVRVYGLWFLLLPFVWLIFLLARNRRRDAALVATFAGVKGPCIFTAALVIAFALASVRAFQLVSASCG